MDPIFTNPSKLLIFLDIPFRCKDKANKNRMRWSPTLKLWSYCIDIEGFIPEEEDITTILFIPDDLIHFKFKFANYNKITHHPKLIEILETIPYEYEKLRIDTLNNPKKQTPLHCHP